MLSPPMSKHGGDTSPPGFTSLYPSKKEPECLAQIANPTYVHGLYYQWGNNDVVDY